MSTRNRTERQGLPGSLTENVEGKWLNTVASGGRPEGSKRLRSTSTSNPPSPSSPTFNYRKDPNQVYVEEEAGLYHDPPVPTKDKGGVPWGLLRPIPPPPPVPGSIFPKTGRCDWSWDEKTRVLSADFSMSRILETEDEKFLFRMMERDDVTVVSMGLLSTPGLDPAIWRLGYIRNVLDSQYLHKIRRFETVMVDGMRQFVECDDMVSMSAKDYNRYVQKREQVMKKAGTGDMIMHYVDHSQTEHSLDVGKNILYVLDLDIGELLPEMKTDFIDHMRLPGVLPGGAHCMMSGVTQEARPFMGPNLYVSQVLPYY